MTNTSPRGQAIADIQYTIYPLYSQYFRNNSNHFCRRQYVHGASKNNRWIFFALICIVGLTVLAFPTRSFAQGGPQAPDIANQLITYTASDEVFPNPERGFYIDIDLINQTNFASLAAQGERIAYAYVPLVDYRTQDLPATFLQKLDAGLARMRASGMKVIIRFSYTSANGPNVESEPDASLAQLNRHLAQMKPTLDAYADAILAMEAGMVGAWGEWHHSSNGLDVEPARSAVFDALLANFPSRRAVLFRFPRDLILHFPTALTSAQAFNGSAQARAGHHNDCFMADYHDSGTWIPEANADALKAYIAQMTQFVPMGGESCNDAPRGDCALVQSEMARFHWSFFDPNMPSIWEGCRSILAKKLGYRLRLVQAELPNQLAPGQTVPGWLDVVNDGYAPPINPRAVELILRNSSTGAITKLAVSTDPRRWLPGATQRVNLGMALPNDLALGNYDLLLSLPDPEPTLNGQVGQRIRLANLNTWESATGFNRLNAVLTVTSGGGNPPAATATAMPTPVPTSVPTTAPTTVPTAQPTNVPNVNPTNTPSPMPSPTTRPTQTALPTPTKTPMPNLAPVANAGPDVNTYYQWQGQLNGTQSSDPNGDKLTYRWTQTGGSPVGLSNTGSPTPTFTVPITPGQLTFQLVVRDPAGLSSAADTVIVTVVNRPPIAHAGYDRTTYPGWKVYLDGARSTDPDTHRITGYKWTQTGGTSVSLSSSTVVSPLFTAPIAPGVLSFSLIATDRFGMNSAVADSVLVTVTNRPPVAHAGYDRIALINRLVQLDGSRSSDPDGHAIKTYSWVQSGGTAVVLSSKSAVSPTFSTPNSAGTLTFKLMVADAYGMSSTVADTVLVTVTQSLANVPNVIDDGTNYVEVLDSEVPAMPIPEIDPAGFEEIATSEVPFPDGEVPTGMTAVYLPTLVRGGE